MIDFFDLPNLFFDGNNLIVRLGEVVPVEAFAIITPLWHVKFPLLHLCAKGDVRTGPTQWTDLVVRDCYPSVTRVVPDDGGLRATM